METGLLWTEEGERLHGPVAEVAPLIPTYRTYSFAVEPSMASKLAVGHRVLVPLGRRGSPTQGFVVGIEHREWDTTLRPIKALVDDSSYLSAELIELGREVALHYCCPLGRTLKAFTPEAVRMRRGMKTVRYAQLRVKPEQIHTAGKRVSPKRRALVEILAREPAPVVVDRLLKESGASQAILRALAKAQAVEIIQRREIDDDSTVDVPLREPTFELTGEQAHALDNINERIDADTFSVTLVFGVSGSGKTELYIRAIRRVVEAGRQAILLVPEIVLTTQIVQRLAARFANVAVNHSGLTEAQRSVIWHKVASGEKTVVIGTRSAVFAPCPNLGLICVDEEQESSYKNLQAPRFHVRDVAIMRAKQRDIPVILGSATPAIETWCNSGSKPDYHRIVIRNRVRGLAMPRVHVVDMRHEAVEAKTTAVLSRPMQRMLGETIERGEQAVILINRRGFAYRLFCPACKTHVECPNCNVSLVVHVTTGQSLCHYCRTRMITPTTCSRVGCGEKLIHLGEGTQRVEAVLAQQFPNAHVERVDSDTMRHRSEYQRIIDRFEAREIDVLVGTQMIAKGLDFPFVSFVGVINADMTGLAGDFRAHERLFQLITQVAGRAGRADAPGRVVVQTTTPEIPALVSAVEHDYESFSATEIAARRRAGLPPYRRLARIVLADARSILAREEADALALRIRSAISELGLEASDVLGPNPCALSRLRGLYRFDLLVRVANASEIRHLLKHLSTRGDLRTRAKSTIVDVDPVTMT